MILRSLFTVLTIIISGFSVSAIAEEVINPFPENVIYTQNEKLKTIDVPKSIDKAMEHAGLETLIGFGLATTANAFDQMHRIYFPRNGGYAKDHRLVMVKAGILPSQTINKGEVYKAGQDAFIIHFQTQTAGEISVYFSLFGLEAVQRIRDEIQRTLQKDVVQSGNPLLRIFIPSARAEDRNCFNPLADRTNPGPEESQNMKNFWGCTKGLGAGTWNATGGAVVSLVKGVGTILFRPVETYEKAASGFRKAEAFVSNLPENLNNMFSEIATGFSALPDQVKWKIGCELTATIGVPVLLAILTSGIMAPRILPAISSALTKIAARLPAESAIGAKLLAMSASIGKRIEKINEAEKNLNAIIASSDKLRDAAVVATDNVSRDSLGRLALEISKSETAANAADDGFEGAANYARFFAEETSKLKAADISAQLAQVAESKKYEKAFRDLVALQRFGTPGVNLARKVGTLASVNCSIRKTAESSGRAAAPLKKSSAR